jgi:hypothetical protein
MAHDEAALALVVEADLLDAQVVAHRLVAALARERGLVLGGSVAHLLPGDPVPAGTTQVVEVVLGRKAAVDDGHDPPEPPAAQIILDLRQDAVVVAVARPHPHPHGDPLAGDG